MLTLGIDYGTTKNAAVLYDPDCPQDFCAVSAPHNAAVDAPEFCAEQDFNKVWQSVLQLISRLPAEKIARVQAVGLTGQMHSAVCWNDAEISPVITWQDKRASATGKLDTFIRHTKRKLADGFGAVSLAAMSLDGSLQKYTHAASPVSLIGAMLCGDRDRVFMEATFGASWGIWDMAGDTWDMEAVKALQIPPEILVPVTPVGSCIGRTCGVPGLPDGIPVCAPIGDNQASVLATAGNTSEELYLTLGTGAQLSAVVSRGELSLPENSPVELRPFTDGRMLVVHAPLCGGKAWAALGNMVNSCFTALGLPPLPERELLDKLDKIALTNTANGVTFNPLFLGRRGEPDLTGEISGLTLENFRLGSLASALVTGMVGELFEFFPPSLIASGKTVLGSGNCVRFCAAVRQEIRRRTNAVLAVRQLSEEAACGAAQLAAEMVDGRSAGKI